MARSVDEAKIASRADRKRLAARRKPYWRSIDPDIHLGYRRKDSGGFWVVRWRDEGGYQQQALGTADDEVGAGTLDFAAAVRSARKVIVERRESADSDPVRTESIAEAYSGLTVQSVVEAYIAIRDARDTARRARPTRSDASIRLGRYVLGRSGFRGRNQAKMPALALKSLEDLREEHLRTWRRGLPKELKETSKRRTINDLKAALNEAFANNRRHLPPEFPLTIKYGLRETLPIHDDGEDVARESQILTDAQVASLIRAARVVDAEGNWEGDFFRLVVVLAATGARMSQIARMRVIDVQFEHSRLMVPASRKGRGRKNPSTPFAVGSDVLEALRPVVEGRPPSALLLERWRNRQIPGGIRWERDTRGPWNHPAEIVRPWAEIRAKVAMPMVIPYALRHSSIVRGLRANQPIRLVASRHDTSVQMIERHYGRYIADLMDEVSARAVVPLILEDDT